MTTFVRALLAALVLLPALAPFAAAAPTSFTINVVDARSLGCSPDFFTSPDLRVRVLVDGAVVATTEKAQDRTDPLFAFTVQASAQLPATIGIEVEEAEPAGFFGTTWVACTVGPGGQTRATFTFSGESALAQTLRGDGDKAAEATLVVGTAPPAVPTLRLDAVGTDSVQLSWNADATGQASGHRLAPGAYGASMGSVAGASASIVGLCDNHAYSFRVIRDAGHWHVASADLSVKTANVAPRAPLVLSATRSGNVSFESQTSHDIARFEVHAASTAGFSPSDDTLRTSLSPFIASNHQSTSGIAFRASDAHVIVRAVDTGGLMAASASFPLEAAARGGTGATQSCGAHGTLSGASQTSPPPTPPTFTPTPGPTPTPTTPPPTTPPPAPTSGQTTSDCCYHLDIRLNGMDPTTQFVHIRSGDNVNVTLVNSGDRSMTIETSIVDLWPGNVTFEPVQGRITLAAGQRADLSILVKAVDGTPEIESVNAAFSFQVVEGNMRREARFIVDVPADLQSDSIGAVVDVKFNESIRPVAAGSRVQSTVLLVNRGSYPVTIEAILAPGIRFDEDVGRPVVAWGFDARPTVQLITLAPYSKQEITVLVDVPANASVGDQVSAQLRFQGNNSVKMEELRPAFFNLEVATASTATTTVSAGGMKGSTKFALVAAGVVATGGLVGFAAWARRDAGRFAMAVALYSRLQKSEMLDHPGREEIRNRIAASPGVCYSELKAETGMNTGALVHHLRALERTSIVTSRKEGAYRRFYLTGAVPAARAAFTTVQTVPALTPTQERVLRELAAGPLTQGELAARMGLTQQGINHHVKAMERAGHIEAVHDGKAWRYRAKQTVDA